MELIKWLQWFWPAEMADGCVIYKKMDEFGGLMESAG